MSEKSLKQRKDATAWMQGKNILQKTLAKITGVFLAQTDEFWRQKGKEEEYSALRAANFGASNGLTAQAASEALDRLKLLRESGKYTLGRIEQYTMKGEELVSPSSFDVGTIFEDYVRKELLKDIVEGLSNGSLAQAEAETQIQVKLAQLAKDPQSLARKYGANDRDELWKFSETIEDFFGRRANKSGKPSEFFASNVYDTAKKIVDDRKALDFANGIIDSEIRVRLFHARWGEQTADTVSDRAMAVLERYRLTGRWVNATTLGAASAVLAIATARAAG